MNTNPSLIKSVDSLINAVRKLHDSLQWSNDIHKSVVDDLGEAAAYLAMAVNEEERQRRVIESVLEAH